MNRESHRYPDLPFRYRDSVRVPGLRSWVPGTWDPIPGTGSTPRAGHRAPKTEPGHWKTRTSGLHPYL